MGRILWYGNSSASDRNPNSSDNPVCLSVCLFNPMANTANKRPINSNIGAANLSFGVILEDYVPGTGAVFNIFLQNYWRLK
jgi:hypothetical protein